MIRIDQLSAQPRRETLRDMLLKKELVLDAVRIPLQRERAVFEMRQNQGGHGVVIVDHIALGVAFVGIEHLLQVGELESVAVHFERGFFDVRE